MAESNNNELPEGFKMTELGPLPQEWKVVRLGDVARVTSGGSAPQGDTYFRGKNPFIRVQHITEDSAIISGWNLITDEAVHKYGLRLFPKGTIVFPKSGASIRLEKRAVLPVDAYIVSHLCALLTNDQLVDNTYLFHTLRGIRFAEAKAEGYPTLSLTEIRARQIPLPPLPEQKAIARVLATIQRAVEAQDKVIAAARQLKKSLMRHLFTYGPVPLSEAEKVPLKETEIGPVPEHWEVVRLGEIFRLSSGKNRPASVEPHPKGACTNPLYGGNGLMGYTSETLISKPTIVLGRVGEYCGSVHISRPHSWISDNALYVKEFLRDDLELFYLASALILLDLNRFKKKSGQPLITQGIVYSQYVPYPSLFEQQEIARILTTVDRKIEAEEKRKAALQTLFKTMLQLLMTGRLRVNKPGLLEEN